MNTFRSLLHICWIVTICLGPLASLVIPTPLYAQQDHPPVPIWSINGKGVAKMGEIVANVGDLDQDGFADVAIGGSGKIGLFTGSEEGLGDEPELIVTDLNNAPAYVDGILAGDFDGDSEVDLLLTAPFEDNSQGAIYLYPGSTAEQGDPWVLLGAAPDSLLGKGIDRGDFNGDGYDDLVVSAPSTHNDEVAGLVYLYYGNENGFDAATEPDLTLEGGDPALRYGDVIRNVGDLNGDGYDDLIIQAEDEELRVDLHPGSADGIVAEPLTSLYAQQYDYIFADSVAALGDVNGDGFADFAVAAANIDDLLIAYLIYGAAEWDALDSESIQLPNTDRLDATVNGVGDVDGDGYNDLAFATVVPTYRDEGVSTVYLFRGGAAGITLEPAYTIRSDVVADGFGQTVAAADVTGDGIVELLIGAPGDTEAGDFTGKIYLYSFTAEAPVLATGSSLRWEPSRVQEILSPDDDDLAGIQATALGDINGDGYDDLGAFGRRGTGDDVNSYLAILLGSADGLGNEPDLAASADNWRGVLDDVEGELIYWHIAGLGDVNGDGYDDFGFTLLTDSGDVALIFAGGADEPDEEPIGILHAPDYDPDNADDYPYYFADKLLGVGDMNGDGYGDIAVVNAPATDENEGLIALYLGGADGVVDEPVWELSVGPMLQQVHPSVAAAGDLNGDGYGDLFIGNPILLDGDADSSSLALFAGNESGLEREPTWSTVGGDSGLMYGIATIAPGDIDGDGTHDLVTSILSQRSILLQPLLTVDPEAWSVALEETLGKMIDDTYLGLGLLPAGDVNGDGYADLLAGYAADVESEEDTFDWRLILGNAEADLNDTAYIFDHPLTTNPDATVEDDLIGLMLKANWQVGDYNGDGYSDLVFGYSDPLSSSEELDGTTPAPLTIYYGGPMQEGVAAADAPITLIAATKVSADAATFASLSPDGQWLLVDRMQEDISAESDNAETENVEGMQLCLIEVADKGDECVTLPELASVHAPFISWSSDSRYISFGEDPDTNDDQIDAWLLDLDSGEMLNLSTLYPPAEAMEFRYDRVPVVAPSLAHVAFVRHSRDESTLNLIDLATETMTTVATVTGIIGNLRWLPDESGILYTLYNEDAVDENGLWQWAAEDGELTQLHQVDELAAIGFITAFSANGNDLLLVYPYSDEEPTVREGHFYELIHLPEAAEDELSVTPLEHAIAALSPDGTRLLTFDIVDGESVLTAYAVVDGVVGEGVEIARNDGNFDSYESDLGIIANWDNPAHLFLSTIDETAESGMLLALE